MKNFNSILKKSNEIKEYRSFDVDAEWNYFISNFEIRDSQDDREGEIKHIFIKESNRHVIYLLSFAASMILIFGLIFLFKKPVYNTSEMITSTNEEKVELVDGTIITLGPNSSLSYFASLDNAHSRSVKLKGNAVFNVSRSILPFNVYYDDVIVKVLGTTFSVYKSGDTVVVNTISGIVQVVDTKDKSNSVTLRKGESRHFFEGEFIGEQSLEEDMPTGQNFALNEAEDIGAFPLKVNSKGKKRQFKLSSVINNYLIKYNNKKIKLDKNFKFDPSLTVTLYNLNTPYLIVLQDLKKQGLIDFIPGKCPDCYIITAPHKK